LLHFVQALLVHAPSVLKLRNTLNYSTDQSDIFETYVDRKPAAKTGDESSRKKEANLLLVVRMSAGGDDSFTVWTPMVGFIEVLDTAG